MIYNEKIASEYGTNVLSTGGSPVAYQPKPTGENYSSGFLIRWFSKRVNETKAAEINPEQRGGIDENLYKTISLTWKISGPKNSKIVNGIIEKSGVEKENLSEIERVLRETEVDLRQTLTNPLELWRGY